MSSAILHRRLQSQHLIGKKFKTPQEVVSHFGAVQAQDFNAAKWSVGQRVQHARDVDMDQAFNEGKIVRTHIMRPTWHFVLPEDVQWMQELTQHRVKQLMNTYNKKLELTDEVFKTCNKEIAKHLKNGNFLTRQELKKVLEGIGVKTDVQRLAHLIMYAELECHIISGPKTGKQLTYALYEERVPYSKKRTHDEALATLMLRYFTSHGPAQLKDFSWWSGLTMKEVQGGISMISSKLEQEVVDGKTYWFSKITFPLSNLLPAMCGLLSIYDEYVIAYKDRSMLGKEHYKKFFTMGNAITGVLVLDGCVSGSWKRKLEKGEIVITVDSFRKLIVNEMLNVTKTAEEYGTFFNRKITLIQSHK